ELLRVVDDTAVEASMIAMFVYAVFYQVRYEYLRSIEDKLPEFLGRLANINQAGVPLSQSLLSLEDTDVGALNEHVERLVRDIRWNATVRDALNRFDRSIESPEVTRAVVLLTKASEASGRVSEVLNIAQRDADMKRKLNRDRRAAMSLYTVVIYISFIVFIVIVAILSTVFIPAIPQQGATELSNAPFSTTFESIEYRTLFYHATVIQGFFAGLIAGKMASGHVSGGVKHSFIMVAVSYVVFTFFLPLV
ncbi:MAG: type II secretion system F family protein, partial [Halobacteria archaeon]|nr:type II secretion system F family protein [Halobacteria archaeon]